MDALTSMAIMRALRTSEGSKSVHIKDLVAALSFMLPDVKHDEASILAHLSQMVSEGYDLPVPVVRG